MVYPDDYTALFDELRDAEVNFVVNWYGQTAHSFTEPRSPLGVAFAGEGNFYFPISDERSWEQLYYQLKATFDPEVVNVDAPLT